MVVKGRSSLLFFWVEPLLSLQREQHPRYMESFVHFWVGIPKSAGDMKLIFICFAPLTHVVWLLYFRHFLEGLHLFGGCLAQWGPPFVLIASSRVISFFITPRPTFGALVLYLEATFLFLELDHTGPASRLVSICIHQIGVAVTLVRSVSLHGPSVWTFLFFATNVTIFSRTCFLISSHCGHLETFRPIPRPYFGIPDAMATSV